MSWNVVNHLVSFFSFPGCDSGQLLLHILRKVRPLIFFEQMEIKH